MGSKARTTNAHLAARLDAVGETVDGLEESVDGLKTKVAGMDVSVATLLEHAKEERGVAREYRQGIREEMHATRSEQSQIAVTLSGVQSALIKVQEQLAEHERERQQVKGAGKIMAAIGRAGWALAGLFIAGLLIVVGYLAKFFALPPGKFGSIVIATALVLAWAVTAAA